jgi:hypothetical protein
MRYLLAFFFFFMYMGDNLGLNISLGPGMSSKNLLLYLILVGIAVNSAVARNRSFELPSVVVPFALVILYAVMTWITVVFILEYPNYGIRESFIALKSSLVDQYVTFLVFFFGLLSLKDSMWLLRAIIWIAILGNVITIVDTLNIPNLGLLDVPRTAGRFEGFVGQPNSYGQLLALFLPACVALYVSESGMARFLAALGTLATVMALILTGSRGSYVGVLAGAVFASFFLRRVIPLRVLLRAGATATVICIFVLAVTFIAGYADIYMERLMKLEGGSHEASSGRTTIWANAIRPMINNPWSFLTGYGFYSYETGAFYRATHNAYILYLYNLGAIGLSLFLVIFGRVLLIARATLSNVTAEYKPHLLAVVFGLFAFLVAIIFSDYNVTGYLLWAYLGVCMRIAVLVKSSVASEVAEQTVRGKGIGVAGGNAAIPQL